MTLFANMCREWATNSSESKRDGQSSSAEGLVLESFNFEILIAAEFRPNLRASRNTGWIRSSEAGHRAEALGEHERLEHNGFRYEEI
jgi:hypothetical protein